MRTPRRKLLHARELVAVVALRVSSAIAFATRGHEATALEPQVTEEASLQLGPTHIKDDALVELHALVKHWREEAQHYEALAVGSHAHRRSHAAPAEGDDPLSNAMAALEHWRRLAGANACAVRGVGPTGGFCMNATGRSEQHSNGCLANRLADHLARLFTHSSVVDLGCGMGQYGERFARRPELGIEWLGLDGSEFIEEASNGRVRFADLSLGTSRGSNRASTADWANSGVCALACTQACRASHAADGAGPCRSRWANMCLVRTAARPLSCTTSQRVPPPNSSPRALELCTLHDRHITSRGRWATDGIVLSWAAPGQPGEFHVNCQSLPYLKCAMGLLGWQLDEAATAAVRTATMAHPCFWLENTLLIFRPSPASDASATLRPLPSRATAAFIQQYNHSTHERCGYTGGQCAAKSRAGREVSALSAITSLMWRAPLSGAEWKRWLADEVAAGRYRLDETRGEVLISDGSASLADLRWPTLARTKMGAAFIRLGAEPRRSDRTGGIVLAFNKSAWHRADSALLRMAGGLQLLSSAFTPPARHGRTKVSVALDV